jgi:ribonuclease R
MKYLEGNLRVSTKGVGYVSLDPAAGRDSESVEIDPNFLNTGLHGDLVKVALHPRATNQPQTGEVVEILERKRMEFVGVLESEGEFTFFVPDDKRVYKDVLIAKDKLAGAKAGDKVQARIIDWHDPKKDPLGEVLLVIGRPGDHETEMQAIVYEKGFQLGFPPGVEEEARELKKSATADLQIEAAKRRDLRDTLTFTIDPVDAKDFDDAISYKELPNGEAEVGVHIADVSHYVRPGTKLDGEAKSRATSIYLVDRTIPMLPEILSNDLCSLNPNEDKLTFSAIFIFTKEGKIRDRWFGRTIIHSDKRFTYEDVQKILDDKAGQYYKELDAVNQLAYKLRKEKMEAGAISFEKDEIKFVLDGTGKPIKVLRKVRTDSHLLVEDFMLLANRAVAEYVSAIVRDAERRFIYRIHDQPDRDKLMQLADFIGPLGYKIKFDTAKVDQRSLNRLLQESKGSPEEVMIQTATMRAMAKAVYATKNIGHYGLAFEHYTHFTSPIRRYPDVMVHRLLDMYLRGIQPSDAILTEYDRLAIHSSQMEIQAAEAERESVKYKQVEYLSTKIGETFDGAISGLAKWGIYVQEPETLAEGMVRLFDMTDDFYIFDEAKYSMIGKNTGKKYRLGDKVKIKLLKADVKEKLLDFAFV